MPIEITQYQVDAFASQTFEGNPAAVCLLDRWLDDAMMQAIAAENNLSETAFLVKEPEGWRIRWFTPLSEVRLCGHATLAAAHVLFRELALPDQTLQFNSLSGPLMVTLKEELIVLDFPGQPPKPTPVPAGLEDALGTPVDECFFNQDYLVVMRDEASVRQLQPDFAKLVKVEARGIIVTAKSADYDFINRFFAPRVGVNEDPVTGSAFTKLIPLWAKRLNKRSLTARQVSARGGNVICGYFDDRVTIAGHSTLFSIGKIYI